ncbi:oxygenase MpaB family protein [Nocardiopsis rhodophaea]|uniref:oxygenase MpaB family protein n=1 Tax=Nocardiopsis rhodophaea TaxID=280238 RepID=UPI0031D9F97F
MTPGLFRENAPIRRINREAVVLGGAGYAVLMQVAHPAVSRGVYEHSDFAVRPVNRLRGTLTFVYGQVFGTREEAERVARIVRAMHTKVNGPGYDALDPDLQLWVAATLYDSGTRLYELALGPLSPEEKDTAYQQASIFATSLGCPRETWPSSRAEFDAYWERMIASMEVDDSARAITRSLFNPANPLLRPFVRLQGFLAAGLLPPRIREQLGLAWSAKRQRKFDRLFAVLRTVYPRFPMTVRTLPMRAYLWDMRRQARRNRLYRRPRRTARTRRHHQRN